MKAIVYDSYGPPSVLKLTTLEQPKPKENEILVKIHATTVTVADARVRSSDFPLLFWLPARLIFGLFKPKKRTLGHELAGVVEAVGSQVSRFKVGDEVFGTTTMLKGGAYAEYVCLPQEWKHGVIALKPKNLSFEAAATLPIGGMTALFLLDKAKLKANQNVLVYGGSGSVGTYAVQLAKQQGATVTAVCSKKNFEMMYGLGADKCIDYKTEDYSKSDDRFDIVFDAVGKTSKSQAKKVLKSNGTFVSVMMMTKETQVAIERIKTFAENGEIKPFIDKTFALEEIVTAHEYVDTGRKRGNLVIQINKTT